MKRWWKLLAVLGVQLAILVAIPLKKVRALSWGEEVTLETVPVDPYDPLSGYYVTLAYAIEQQADVSAFAEGDEVLLVVEGSTPAFRLLSAQRRVGDLRNGRVGIKARVLGGRARIDGIGRFYIPEAQRERVEGALASVGRRALVDVKVSADGTPAILRLRAGPETFGD
ncbi:MAG: GDYXXLXY domain-containing protein [Deltaproteobacteria bacterium]|nr:GDYXXLXY domain-containing protein [Deltaproteobacteria bacterium]